MAASRKILEPEPPKFWRPELPGDLPNGCGSDCWLPAPEWQKWMRATFIDKGAPLLNEEHVHLRRAKIGVLMTNAEYRHHGRRVAGTAQLVTPGSGWGGSEGRARRLWYFGFQPHFVIRLDATLIAKNSPAWVCALVEHELLHCGHARDMFGCPRFAKKSGRPIFGMRAHDVGQFDCIVERYGAKAAGTEGMMKAGQNAPLFDDVDITSICCGTCP